MTERPPSGRWLAGVLWALLALQCLAAFIVMKPWATADSAVYLRLAAGLGRGYYGTVSAAGFEPDILRPPGYPIILWSLRDALGLPIAAIVALQLGLYLSSLWMIGRYLKDLGCDHRFFLLACCAYPFSVLYCAAVMTEAWTMAILTGLALLAARNSYGWRAIAMLGLGSGLAALIRSDLLLLSFLLAAMVAWRTCRHALALGAIKALAVIAGALLVVMPYALWNGAQLGRPGPAPIASAVGNSLYLATWQGILPLDDLNALYAGKFTTKTVEAGMAAEVRTLNGSFGAEPNRSPLNPASYPTNEQRIQSGAVFGAAALKRIAADPRAYGGHVASNFWALWNSSAYPAFVPPSLVTGLKLLAGLASILGGVGIVMSMAGKIAVPPRMAAVMLYPMAIHLPLHTEARYTAAARPLLIMFAALAMVALCRSILRDRTPKLG